MLLQLDFILSCGASNAVIVPFEAGLVELVIICVAAAIRLPYPIFGGSQREYQSYLSI